MGRGKQKEWARRDKKSDPFARQKNRTTNEYRQFPRLKWVVHSVHEAEQTRAEISFRVLKVNTDIGAIYLFSKFIALTLSLNSRSSVYFI